MQQKGEGGRQRTCAQARQVGHKSGNGDLRLTPEDGGDSITTRRATNGGGQGGSNNLTTAAQAYGPSAFEGTLQAYRRSGKGMQVPEVEGGTVANSAAIGVGGTTEADMEMEAGRECRIDRYRGDWVTVI